MFTTYQLVQDFATIQTYVMMFCCVFLIFLVRFHHIHCSVPC